MAMKAALWEIQGLPGFEHLRVGCLVRNPAIGCIELARPERSNAFNEKLLLDELPKAVTALDTSPTVHVVLLTGAGKNFCAGIDISYLQTMFDSADRGDPGLFREGLRRNILRMQDAVTCLERCRHPVIAVVQGACFGGGVDLITACDLRICSEDARFCVKEADLGLAADMGTLQRLPYIVGHAAAMELSLTAATISSEHAAQIGLVSQVVSGRSAGPLLEAAAALAANIAAKPPLAIRSTKRVLLRARDSGNVADNLDYVATWNAGVLINQDLERQMRGTRGARAKPVAKL